MPHVAGIGNSTLDQRIRNTASPPRLVHVALRHVRAPLIDASGTYEVARQRIGSDVGEYVTDEPARDLGNEQAVTLGIGNKSVKHVGAELRGDMLRNRFLGQVLRTSIRERARRKLTDCDDVLKLSLSYVEAFRRASSRVGNTAASQHREVLSRQEEASSDSARSGRTRAVFSIARSRRQRSIAA